MNNFNHNHGVGFYEKILMMLLGILLFSLVVNAEENIGVCHFIKQALILKTKNIDISSDNQLCMVMNGTKCEVLESGQAGVLPVVKIRIKNGDCNGKEGWASQENIRLEISSENGK